MPGYVLGNFFIYSVINAFTPGPGNILALNTVTNYGYKKGRPLYWGIFAGYYVVQIICAVFVFGVSTFLPDLLGIMKYIGAAYILWLAVRIALSKPTTGTVEKSASFLKGFLLQFVNVKIYLFGITALTGHEPGDVLMLTGVGEVFPFMRIHTLLEALQPYFSDVPILVMYPGEFDGRHVKLFNRLTPNDYYRAFNVIE